MRDYAQIFRDIEQTLISLGSKTKPVEEIESYLDGFRGMERQSLDDNGYYRLLVGVVFYSGMRAATVTKKMDTILGWFPDYETAASYDENDRYEMLDDPKMLKNERKIDACIKNAHVFCEIIDQYGSFGSYVDSFDAEDSFENLMMLKEELEYRLLGIGKITIYHFLTDLGMNVIKPDRVICRLFERLGLIEHEGQLLKTVILGRKFAEATGEPIRYIDRVLVAYGQVNSYEIGLEKGICLNVPDCARCNITQHCQFLQEQAQGFRPFKAHSIPMPLAEATKIKIIDSWSGLGVGREAKWELSRADDHFTGLASFSVDDPESTDLFKELRIPLSNVASFLATLQETPLKRGAYTPYSGWSDDFPFLSININTPDGEVSFYSESQGEHHLPWGVKAGKRAYSVQSSLIAEAYDSLKQLLNFDVFERMFHDASSD